MRLTDITMFLNWCFWVGLICFTGHRATSFPCPRCNKPFFRDILYHNSFAKKCVHCGFPKWGELTGNEKEKGPS